MALPEFTPVMAPSTSGTTVEVAIRSRDVRFGDGYGQRAENGLNPRPRSGTWAWSILDSADADDMVDFLSTNAVTGFRYTLVGDSERKFKLVGKISIGYVPGNLRSVTVQVEEIFDP